MNCTTTKGLQGRYRPAVRAAWLAACAQTGGDPADRIAHDQWYRAHLDRLAGISTTKGADSKTLETLIEGFLLLLADSTPHATPDPLPDSSSTFHLPPSTFSFSPAQQAAFNRLVAKAWRKVQDFDPSVNFEAWLNARMADCANGSPGFSGGNLFDRTMCLFGVIAGDDFWIKRTAEARERRLRHVIRGKLAELGRLSQRELDWSYVQGICTQAKLASSLDDCPAENLRSVLAIIDAALRKERQKH
jgi:hypothetical protein